MIIQPYLEFSIVLCVIIQRPVDIIQFDVIKRFEQHIVEQHIKLKENARKTSR